MQMANILAVDDDEKIRELLSTVLRRKGHRVLTGWMMARRVLMSFVGSDLT
jgi:DNA-binding NtrC family response regulator